MILDKYKKNAVGIWTRNSNLSFNYSDGEEIENRLLKNVTAVEDVSLASDELQSLIVDWPSEYHFSPLRPNLLSPFRFDKFPKIFEIGSGCGAITRLLGEKCPNSDILALEGSMRRAEITRARCRDLKNVDICQDSFTDFEHNDSFDLITMIGVLEYSPSFFISDKPILEALNKARSLLNANGVLVIAIENQLGLKYFNGCSEDHNGQPFHGINDLYKTGTARTLGKKQIKEKIQEAGFKSVEFVFPFPDYKLPQLLLREEAFLCNDLNVAHLIGQYPARDYGDLNDRVFHEARVWNVLSRNGLIQDMANSFLVFASNGEKTVDDLTKPWLARAFSCRRKKKYLIQTEFKKENEDIIVEKNLSYPSATVVETDISKNIIHHVGRSAYVKGTPYCYTLMEFVPREDSLASFIEYLSPWLSWLHGKSFEQSIPGANKRLMVPGELYDCMPANFLFNEQQNLSIIDQEWELTSPLELGFVLFRGLYRELCSNIMFFEQTDMFADGTIEDMLKKIFKTFDCPFDQETIHAYLDLEVDIQLQLVPYSVGKKELIEYVKMFIEQKRTRKSQISDLLISGGMGQHATLAHLVKMQSRTNAVRDEQIFDLNRLLAERDEMLDAILRSRSWRITVPLRLAGYIAKRNFYKFAIVNQKLKQLISNLLITTI